MVYRVLRPDIHLLHCGHNRSRRLSLGKPAGLETDFGAIAARPYTARSGGKFFEISVYVLRLQAASASQIRTKSTPVLSTVSRYVTSFRATANVALFLCPFASSR